MNKVMQYVIECADKGDLAEFLKNCDRNRKYIYNGQSGLDLHIENGEVTKVFCDGRELKLVEV